ncbi:colicin import membrane protein [Propionicimonas paludicola]|uniref:Colicin import membrane protein n=1 Tax=Propionicimonas paludicola TaxID=185243 RepID=A0A2A9CS69_9ACTN|nr:hypothetical protein [Propionicimonas paludicola]PFG16976.1 colicin import membrane protein [Propionicimonas paludicola]
MTAQLAPRPTPERRRPRLRPVPQSASSLATIPFVAVVAGLLALGMVGILVLTTALQSQAFVVQDRQHQAAVLATKVSGLQAAVADKRSVQSLAVAAQSLGMRPNPVSANLRLDDGDVIGKASAVSGIEVPSIRYLTDEQVAAQVAAMDKAEADRKAKAEAARKAKADAKAAQAQAQAEADAQAAAGGQTGGAPQADTTGRG